VPPSKEERGLRVGCVIRLEALVTDHSSKLYSLRWAPNFFVVGFSGFVSKLDSRFA
jgi:hypothetical protein